MGASPLGSSCASGCDNSGLIRYIVPVEFSGLNILRNRADMIELAAKSMLPAPRASVPLGAAILLVGGVLQFTHVYFTYGSVLIVLFLAVADVFIHPIWKPSERASASINFCMIGLLIKCGLVGLF